MADFWTILVVCHQPQVMGDFFRHLWALLPEMRTTGVWGRWGIGRGGGGKEGTDIRGRSRIIELSPPLIPAFSQFLPLPRCAKLSKNSSLNGGRCMTGPPFPRTIFLFKLSLNGGAAEFLKSKRGLQIYRQGRWCCREAKPVSTSFRNLPFFEELDNLFFDIAAEKAFSHSVSIEYFCESDSLSMACCLLGDLLELIVAGLLEGRRYYNGRYSGF